MEIFGVYPPSDTEIESLSKLIRYSIAEATKKSIATRNELISIGAIN